VSVSLDRRASLSGIRRLFRWRATCSTETSEAVNKGGDTWLADLLERASREEDDDCQDFAPRHQPFAPCAQAAVRLGLREGGRLRQQTS
jgi:hypothetical protein